MTQDKPATIHNIETASTARWLNRTLSRARARAKDGPSAEAVDRIRARVFGEQAEEKTQRSIAA